MAVGVVGGLTIHYSNASMQEAIGSARERAEVAAGARLAVIGIDRAQAKLVSATTTDGVRRAAVSAIKAASLLDENLQILEKKLTGNPLVAELVGLNQQVTSTRMIIIKAAKSRNIEKAQEQTDAIAGKIARIEEVSDTIFTQEQGSLSQKLHDSATASAKILLVLAAFVFATVVVAAVLSILFSRQLSCAIQQIQKTIGVDKAEDDFSSNDLVLAAQAGNVSSIAHLISVCGANMAGAVDQIQEGAIHVQNATDASAKHLDFAVAQIEKMSASVDQNVKSIVLIVGQFEIMKSELQTTIGATKQLQRSVGDIREIADTISEISRRTNMLALNASIEAARAGSHGRGFAVVAGEVRNLAQHTGDATAQIHGLAEGIDSEVGKTIETLNRSAANAQGYAKQLGDVLAISNETSSCTIVANDMVAAVITQMNAQRVAVASIKGLLSEVMEAAALTQEQSMSLTGVSNTLNESAIVLADMARAVRM